ncbi:MAG: VCBS repeat-containing protein [Bdellovibrionales bacterium]|nr:VCBS repeat-containing protein [Bdellovibrionales bacterium]
MSRITINSNVSAIVAQRHLSGSTETLHSTLERLSSGLRITRASDDPAALALADPLRAEIALLAQASRNISDGVSMLSIAEAALQEIGSIGIRIAELAEQAANGVYSNDERSALNQEALALRDEYERIVASTEFNAISLIGETVQSLNLQVHTDSQASSQIRVDLPTLALSQAQFAGSFEDLVEVATFGEASGIASADFDQDGNQDVVVISDTPGSLSYFFGHGDGTFTAETTISGVDQSWIRVGDVNGDTLVDLIYPSLDNTVRVALNDGSRGFTESVVGNPTGITRTFQVGDFNGDGDLDFVLGIQGQAAIQQYIGNGNGTFQAPVSVSTGGLNIWRLDVADYNNDGRDDVSINVNGSGATVRILLANANGSFKAPVHYANPYGQIAYHYGVDVNNDGILDITSKGSTGEGVYLGNGDGTFKSVISDTIANYDLFDIDGDGDLDGFTGSGGNVGMVLNNGDGTFAAEVTFVGTASQAFHQGADFNNDGVNDLLYASGAGNSFALHLATTTVGTSGSLDVDLSSRSAALTTLDETRSLIDAVSLASGAIGATMSRLETALSNTQVSRENTRNSESIIRDVDVAEASAQLVKSSILQDAGAFVLVQANQTPEIALLLLDDL